MSKPTRKRQTLHNVAKHSLGKLVPAAIQAIGDAVMAGDVNASVQVLSWIIPKPAPTHGRIEKGELEVNGKSLQDKSLAILDAVIDGRIESTLGEKVMGLIQMQATIFEKLEFEKRLQALEAKEDVKLVTHADI